MIMSKGIMGNEQRPLRVRDGLLMALTLSSGAVDAISFLALGKVFTAFMTGNLVFLGLLAVGSGTQSLISVVASIAFFAAGVYLATRIVGPSRGSGAWPHRATASLGVTAGGEGCFLGVWGGGGGPPPGWGGSVPLPP